MRVREEVAFTKRRIIVRGKLVSRGKAKRADYILYYKADIRTAIIAAKDNNHSVGDGMQQAVNYATRLNIPFVFSSNGDGSDSHKYRTSSLGKSAAPSTKSKLCDGETKRPHEIPRRVRRINSDHSLALNLAQHRNAAWRRPRTCDHKP